MQEQTVIIEAYENAESNCMQLSLADSGNNLS
jgi:hypothetical protein